jgi:soluble lytic murein transglycosylase
MRKIITSKTSLVVSCGLITTGFVTAIGLKHSKWQIKEHNQEKIAANSPSQPQSRFSVTLTSLSEQQKKLKPTYLPELDSSFSDSRASFSLAADLLKQNKGEEALKQLQGLEQDYPLLAPYILLKQGQAYAIQQKHTQAQEIWQKLLDKYPDSPATAEALYQLGQNNFAYWQQAIAQFPQHPRSQEIARQLLKQNPNQPKLMLLLVKYTTDDQEVEQLKERLVNEYASQLTAEDWQAIADSYWQKWQYQQAGKAYSRAPKTPRNLYRTARGLHLGGNQTEAQKYYQQLLQAFPDTEETGLGLRRLATIVSKQEALAYLDLVINQFPQEAAQALLEKADILESLNSHTSAAQARQLVLTNYANSDAAAEYRWRIAQKKAQEGDLVAAWQWAQPIAINNPENSLAPKAAFWVGKWASKLGRTQEAKTAFESVLRHYPQSYYAWRSAVALGWNVGDFTTIRQIQPQVGKFKLNFVPSAGSVVFQELYQLGLQEEAWNQFQTEFANQENLTVAEEFTYGLLQLYRGKNLRGINQIDNLQAKNEPDAKQQWHAIQQTLAYWQALYPFLFQDSILQWSQQRQLNPLLVTALIRQESRFEPEIRSSAGALGLMQVMPETGKWVATQINLQNYSLINPEDNINLGTFYLDYTHRRYNNNSMLAVASYNAGPNNVAKWISRYGLNDRDEFVEKIPFPETKGYVESVFENYWNYMLIYNPEIPQLFKQIS